MTEKNHSVDIGSETYEYITDEHYTYIFNEDGERIIVLKWVVKSENEVKASLYGYGRGIRTGEKIGSERKMREIKKALEIT